MDGRSCPNELCWKNGSAAQGLIHKRVLGKFWKYYTF